MSERIKNELGNLVFASGYLSEYRYYKQLILEKEYENIQNLTTNLREEQYESLRQMIEVEMIVNAVQYCSELGAFAVCVKNKNIIKIQNFLASLTETDIQFFFKNIEKCNPSLVSKYMGYHEVKIEQKDEYKYSLSCERYKNDIIRIANFYNQWYPLYLSYKHGLRIIPAIDENTHKKIIIEACKDNTSTIYVLPEAWWLVTIEIITIVREIYRKLYVPLIRKEAGEYLGIPFDSSSISTKGEDKAPPDPNRSIHRSISFTNPWWIHEHGEPNPFY
jgi:hypothetical protein